MSGDYACYYNQNIECRGGDCTECGWDPYVSEKRLEAFLKRNGIKRKDTERKVVDAEDIKLRIKRDCIPLAEKGYSAFNVLVKAMKCIDQAALKNVEEVTHCEECMYWILDDEETEGTPACKNESSPCRGARMIGKDFCPYGKMKNQEEEKEE